MTALRILTAPVFEPLLGPARYKGARGGRGSGKSWFFAELLIEHHLVGKTDSVCLREVQKTLRFSAHKLLSETIARMNAGYYFEVQDKVIKARNGGIIVFNGMHDHTADSIKSLEGFDRAWFEEAQTCSQKSLDLLRPTLRKAGSELWFSWNPFKEDDPIELLLCSPNAPEDRIVVTANIDDNPWPSAELLEERESDRKLHDPDKFANIWEGAYLKNSEGDYYKHQMAAVRAEKRICRIPRLDLPANTFWDIGNSDGCAVWIHQQVGMEDRFIGYYEDRGQTLGHYVRQLKALPLNWNKHFLPHDAAHKRLSDTNKSTEQMLNDLGLVNTVIVPVISDLNRGIQMTRNHFPSAYFDEEACREGIKRLENYRKKFSTSENRWMDEPNKANGCSEAADAFRQWAQAKEGGLITMAGATRFVRPRIEAMGVMDPEVNW
ncbi:MAG TPA: PBSX family phage terminase large subunit [Burkholderiaceae bacterium]